MTRIQDLRTFFEGLDYKVVIAADGETRAHKREGDSIIQQTPAGGVATTFDVLCQASGGTYIGRARTEEDLEVVDRDNRVEIAGRDGNYCLKRLFLTPEEESAYYAGFSNQTLWPLCHIAFERPIFNRDWFEEYVEVNRKFAESIQGEIDGKTFVWINDYQLSMVPAFLQRSADTIVGLFWHIPWPTWEIFRILPYKQEILRSMLNCDYIGFHRRYQARNFLNAVDQELGARIDFETNSVHVDGTTVRVGSVPMGIDVDLIRDSLTPDIQRPGLLDTIRSGLGLAAPTPAPEPDEPGSLNDLYERYRILLGVDRLDYTKGIKERLHGLDRFFEQNPNYKGQTVYVGIMSPTRDAVPAYQGLRDEIETLASEINERHRTGNWEPLHMVFDGVSREGVIELYREASVCLVTPVDDGMNLVSKEYIVAASLSDNPGMLVLSQFAGSATDLTASVIVNPYDTDALAAAIKTALEMDPAERRARIDLMVELLEERNVYEWAMSFVRNSVTAAREQQHEAVQIG